MDSTSVGGISLKMRQKKWKYAKPQKKFNFDEYLILPLDKKFKITIKNWVFYKADFHGENISSFRTDVTKLDNAEVSKILVIKNYDNVCLLKKALSKKTSARSTADLEISRHQDEDLEYYFKLKILK